MYIVAILLLLFNGAGAIYGGLALIRHPDGSSIGLSVELLRYTPFSDYTIPGVVLLMLNGIIDLLILLATLARLRSFYFLVCAQGCVLLLWLLMQIALIRVFDQMHLIMGVTALLLIGVGLGLRNSKTSPSWFE